jgi:hypothetical protein
MDVIPMERKIEKEKSSGFRQPSLSLSLSLSLCATEGMRFVPSTISEEFRFREFDFRRDVETHHGWGRVDAWMLVHQDKSGFCSATELFVTP